MNLDNLIQYKSELTPGLVNTNPTLSQVILPNTFEDTIKGLMDTPMPTIYHIPTLQLDHGIDVTGTNESLGSKLDGLLVGLDNDLRKKDPNYNNPLHGGRTVPIDEVMPYVKTSNDYGSNLTAALGQGAKGATSGALLGMSTAAIASAPVGELGGAAPLGGAIIGGIAGGATGFISGLFGVSGKQGYKIGRDNQEYTAQLQSGVGNRLTGFANNLINRTFETSIGGTAALLSTPFGAIMGKDFHDWGSNPLSESLSEGVENSEYKAKLSKNYMNKGPFSKFFTGEGLQNEMADMAGFTLGMIGGMKITSGLNVGSARLLNSVFDAPNVLKRGKLIGDFLPTVGKQASMLFNQGIKAERTGLAFSETTFSKGIVGGTQDLGKAVWNNGAQGAKEFFEGYGMKLNNAFKEGGVGLASLSSFERTMLASYGEGRIEAANAYKDTYNQAVKEGRSLSEASDIADKAANKTLLGNLAVLGITNQFGLNQLMNTKSSILNLGKWFTKDWAVDNTTKTLVKNILNNTTKQMGKGIVMEGFAEELGQFAISEGAKNYELNTANPNNPVHTSFLHEIIDAYREGLTSDEGISNWFGGALFGSIMGVGGFDGGIAGQITDRRSANKLEIPEALKTPIDKMTKASLFMSEHTAPYNGQLFQTYSQDEDGVLIPDPAGTIRKINDPGRISQLAKALAHINQLSTDQSMVIASSLADMTKGYTGDDANLKTVFETLKDYIDTSDNGVNAKQSLETYLQTKDNNIRRKVYSAIAILSQQKEGAEITDDNLRKMYVNLVKSNYVYDHVSNGVEQNLFTELDRLEESIANPNSESAKKDGVEFFGKLYKSTEIEQAKADISNFRDDLTRQVDLYKSLANRYNEPLTHIIINKGKDKYRIPITVNLKKVFRSALVQADIQESLEAIASAIDDTKTALYELPSLKKMYMDPAKTSVDVDKLLDSEEFTDKNSPEYKRYMFLKNADKENLEWLEKENKHFEKLTNKDNLIKEALEHEKTLNTFQETVVPKAPVPKPAPPKVEPTIDEGPLRTPKDLIDPEVLLAEKKAADLAAKEAVRLAKEAEKLAETEAEKQKAKFARQLAEKKAKEAALALLALQTNKKQNSSPESTQTVPDSEIEEIKKILFIERIPAMIRLGIIEEVYQYGQRPIVVVNINGELLPFYRSSQGTSGKEKGVWFPMFGFGRKSTTETEMGWLIKPTIKDLENNLGSKAIEKYSNIINSTLNWAHILDTQSLDNPFFKPFVTLTTNEEGFNKKIFGKEDLGVFNDGKTSYAHIDSIVNKINTKYEAQQNSLQDQEDDNEDTMTNDNNWDSATPLTEETIFKTHSVGTTNGNTETQHSAFHKYLDDVVNPENNEHAIFPVALDSELGNKIKAKEMSWYNKAAPKYVDPKNGKEYSPFLMKGHEVLYVLTKQVGGQTHVIREGGNTMPLIDIIRGASNTNNQELSKLEEERKKELAPFHNYTFEEQIDLTNQLLKTQNTLGSYNESPKLAFSFADREESFSFLTAPITKEGDLYRFKGIKYNVLVDKYRNIRAATGTDGSTYTYPPNKIGTSKMWLEPQIHSLHQYLDQNVIYNENQQAIINAKYDDLKSKLNTDAAGVAVPIDLLYSKSSAPHPQAKGESIEDTHKRWVKWVKGEKKPNYPKDIKQEFSTKDVENLTDDKIVEIVGTYLNGLNQMYKDGLNPTEKTFLNILKPITGVTPGVSIESLKTKKEAIGDEFSFKVATLSKDQQVGTGQTLKKGRVYAYKEGKYYTVRYRDYTDKELDTITSIVMEKMATGTVSAQKENYLRHTVNWFDLLTDTNAGQQNSVGIVGDSIVFAPAKKDIRREVSIEDFRKELATLKHFINKNVESADLFTDLATDTTYQGGYSEYLRVAKVLMMTVPLNDNEPIQKNRQLVFGMDYSANKYELVPEQRQETAITAVSNYENYNYPPGVPQVMIDEINDMARTIDWNTQEIGTLMVPFPEDGYNLKVTIHPNHAVVIEDVIPMAPLEETKEDEKAAPAPTEKIEAATTVTPEEVDKLQEIQSQDNIDDVPFRLNPLRPYEHLEDVATFSDWLSKVLPRFTVTTESQPIEGIAQGQLIQNVIRIWEGAEKGTGFHEAFEAVWANILSPEQQKDLLAEFRGREGKFEYPFDGRILQYSQTTDKEAKEMLAEEFMDFMKTTKITPNPKVNTFFYRLKQAIIDLINQIKAFFGSTSDAKETINNIYENIAKGEYFNRNINSFYPYAENRLIKRFTTPDVDFSDMQDALDIIHDKFIEEVLENNDNTNIYNLLDDADNAETSLSEFIGRNIAPIIDKFEVEMKEVALHPDNRANPAKSQRAFINANTLFADKITQDTILKPGLKEELKKLYIEQFLNRSKLKDFVDFQAIDEVNTSSKEGRVSEDEINPTSNVNTVIRFLLGTIYHTDELGNKKLMEDSTPWNKGGKLRRYVKPSAHAIQNVLLNTLSNIDGHYYKDEYKSTFNLMIDALDGLLLTNKNKYGWVYDLKKKLNGPLTNGENKLKLKIAFENSFHNLKFNPLSLQYTNDNRLMFLDPVLETNIKNTIQSWISTLKDLALQKHHHLQITADNNVAFKNFIASENPAENYRFFRNLGLDFGAITAEKTEALEAVIGVLMEHPEISVRELFEKQANSRMYTLAKNSVTDSNEALQNYIKSTGKTAHTIINPNTVGRSINKINSVATFSDLAQSLPHLLNKATGNLKYGLKNNVFLRSNGLLFGNDGKKHKLGGTKITLSTFDGMAIGATNEGVSFTGLSNIDKLKLKVNGALHNTFSLLINSDKSTEWALRLSKQIVDYKTYCAIPGVKPYVDAFLIPQLRDELEILFNKEKAYQVKIFKDNTDGQINLGRFTDILNLSQAEYDQLLKNKDVDNFIKYIYPRLETWAKDDFHKFGKVFASERIQNDLDFEQACKVMNIAQLTEPIMGYDNRGKEIMIGTKKLSWETTYFTKMNGPDNKDNVLISNLAKFVYFNYEVFNNDIQQLLYGNKNMYKPGDEQKRWNFITSSKQPSATSPDILNEMNRIIPRLDGKIRDGYYNNISYQDVESVSSATTVIAEMYYEAHKNHGTPHEDAQKIIGAEFNEVTGKLTKISDKTKGTLIGPYLKLESADAQAFMTGDGYRDLMYTSGKLNSNQIALINWEQAYERTQRNNLEETDPRYYKYRTKKARTDDDALLAQPKPVAILQVIKPQGSGYNEDVDIVTPMFLKNSVLPLFWSRVQGNKRMEAIYLNAQKNKVDIIGFNSGQKMGNILNSEGKLTPLYDRAGNAIEGVIPPIQKISMEDFGLQVETANVYKSESPVGIQARKIVTGNLVDHMEDPIVAKAVSDYYENLNNMISLGTDDLYSKLGIKLNTITGAYEVDNVENLSKSLKEQGLGLDLLNNVMDLFEVVDGKLPYKFDASTERRRIEFILSSILDKALVHQKVKGTQAPQVSSILERHSNDLLILKDGVYVKVDDFSKLTPEEQSQVRIGSNDLQLLPDGTIEVKIPSYLGDNVDISKVDPKLLELIGYRIPTQSMGQIEKIKVVGFLDKSYGDCIFVPAELVGKSGSDFDIDKLNLYLPHYYADKNGEHQIINYDDDKSEDGVVRRYNAYVRRRLAVKYKEEQSILYASLKGERDALDAAYKALPNKNEKYQSIAFYKLPLSIQQQYKEHNVTLTKLHTSGVDKTLHFIDYTNSWTKNLENTASIDVQAYNRDTKTHYVQTINSKELVSIFNGMLSEYADELAQGKITRTQVDAFITKRNEYRDYKSEVADNLAYIGQSVSFSDPNIKTLDEFRDLSIGAQNTREALENRNIKLMRDLISLPQNRLQHLAPNSAATLEALDKTINGESKLKSYEISSLIGSTIQRHILSAAKDLVSIGAVNVTGHNVAQIGKVTLGKLVEGVRYVELLQDGNYVLFKQYDNKNNLISSNISEYLSGFVDAAKDPFVVRLNINKNTLPQLMLLQRLGLSIEDSVRFVNQPVIKQYLKYIDQQDSFFRKAKGTISTKKDIQLIVLVDLLKNTEVFDVPLKRYGRVQDLVDLILRDTFNPGSFGKDEKRPTAYDKRIVLKTIHGFLEDYITRNDSVNYTKDIKSISNLTGDEYKYAQAIILKDFISMYKPAQALGDLNNAANIDSKKPKTLVENTLLIDSTIKGFNLGNAADILSKTHLDQTLRNRRKFTEYLSPFLIVAENPNLRYIINQASEAIAQDIGSKNKDAVLNSFTNYLITYIIQNSPNFDKNYAMFDPESGLALAKRIKNIKDHPEYKAKNYKFFNNLSFRLTQLDKDIETNLSYNVMLYNSKAETIDRNIEIARYEEILEKAENFVKWGRNRDLKDKPDVLARFNFYRDVLDVMNNMVTFSILQSGVDSTSASLQPTLPAGLYCEAVDKYIQEFDTKDLKFDMLWKMFHQQKWSDSKIVKRTKHYLTADENNLFTIPGETRKYINNYGPSNINLALEQHIDDETGFKSSSSRLLQLVDKDYDNNGLYQEITRIGNGNWGMVTLTEDTADMIPEDELPFNKTVAPTEQHLSYFKPVKQEFDKVVDEETNEPIEPVVTTQETVEDDTTTPVCKGGAPF